MMVVAPSFFKCMLHFIRKYEEKVTEIDKKYLKMWKAVVLLEI